MIPHEQLMSALDDAERRLQSGASEAPLTISVEGDPERLDCHLLVVERLACQVLSVSLEVPTPYSSPAPPDPPDLGGRASLRQRAQRLESAISYLEEPLQLVEFDSQTGHVMLRSAPPRRLGAQRLYFELVAGPRRIQLQRWTVQTATPRAAIPATLTRETLDRLVADLAGWWG